MAHVLVIKGQDAGKEFTLGESCVLGRSVSADVILHDAGISRKHAQIEHKGGQYFLKDLGSQNGTFLNGEPLLAPSPLRDGYKFQIGGIVLAFYRDHHGSDDQMPTLQDDDTATLTQYTIDAGVITPITEKPVSGREKKLHRYLTVLYDISSAIGTILDVDELVQTILVKTFDAFPQADLGVVLVRDEDDRMVPKAMHSRSGKPEQDLRLSRTLIKTAVDQRQSILSLDVQNDPRFDGSASIMSSMARSIMCVPLVFRNQVLGLIQLETHKKSRPFQQEDLMLLNGVGAEAAAAIQSARLHRQAVQMQLLRHDLEIAQTVQQHFLPAEMPQIEGYDFVAKYESALQVSGDFFDFIPFPDGQLGIVIGDVSGKGISAGLVMAKLTSELRFAALTDVDPAQVISRVNQVLCKKSIGMIFATVMFLRLDPATGNCICANAGHLPGFYRSADGEVSEIFGATGMPVGIMADETYSSVAAPINPGDLLLLVTDGVTEAKDASGENFGFDRLKDVIKTVTPHAEMVTQDLRLKITTFTSGQTKKDDIAIIAISRKDDRG